MMKRMLHSFDDFISLINYHRDMCDDIDQDDDDHGSVGVAGEKNRCRRIFSPLLSFYFICIRIKQIDRQTDRQTDS